MVINSQFSANAYFLELTTSRKGHLENEPRLGGMLTKWISDGIFWTVTPTLRYPLNLGSSEKKSCQVKKSLWLPYWENGVWLMRLLVRFYTKASVTKSCLLRTIRPWMRVGLWRLYTRPCWWHTWEHSSIGPICPHKLFIDNGHVKKHRHSNAMHGWVHGEAIYKAVLHLFHIQTDSY